MENTIQFIADLNSFINLALSMFENIRDVDVLISGTFDSIVYRDILNRLVAINNLGGCKMIIPYIAKNGMVSRNYTNKIIDAGGEVRLNSRFNNNLLVIGDNAFILTFNQKYKPGFGMKNSFESCVVTNYKNAVGDIKKVFMNNWHNSLPINIV